MNSQLSLPYIWSIYIISTGLAILLPFAVISHLFMNLNWWQSQVAFGAIALYAYLTARQLYTHGRLWPRKVLLLIVPLSFLHFLLDVQSPYKVGLFIFNIAFWCASYQLSAQLVKLRPYKGPSGIL